MTWRRQTALIGNIYSDYDNVKCGEPQGTASGPISDLCKQHIAD